MEGDGLRKRNREDGEVKSPGDDALGNEGPQKVVVERVRKVAKQLHENCMEQMDKSLNQMVEDIVHEIEHSRPFVLNSLTLNEYSYCDRSEPKQGCLPEKRFMSRRSPLTEMFESEHIRTIYNIFIAFFVLLFLNTVIYDYVDTGKLNLDFELIQYTFSQFHVAMTIWGLMLMATVLFIYPGFHRWATNRHSKNKLWDYAWITLYMLYICMFFYIPVLKMVEYDLPPASSLIVLAEQVRLLMKSHAFVRSNILRAVNYDPKKNDENGSSVVCPNFSKFFYFLFVPTLVYRDNYPRCSQINWNYVFSNFCQVVGCLFYTYFVFVRFLVPVFHKFGQEPMSPKNLVLSVFGCMLPGILVLLCTFFAILHSWLNAFAEMLRFSDRMFYKDWWNSASFANYYRTWNVVVHDWLYTYIFCDVFMLVKQTTHRKLPPTLTVFAVSALVHEYLIALAFRFFYPVLLVLFGTLGVILVFVTNQRKGSLYGNIFMWFGLVMGTGLLMSLYSMEYYARINCPRVTESFLDYFIPRSLMCNAIQRDHA